MSIDPSSATPVFRQIVDHVQRLIASGVYRPGELIPSVRGLAMELRVNPNTVQRAYQALERAGVVAARKGVGMAVTDGAAASARGRARESVLTSFRMGVRSGRAASLSDGQIRDTFHDALHEPDQEADS